MRPFPPGRAAATTLPSGETYHLGRQGGGQWWQDRRCHHRCRDAAHQSELVLGNPHPPHPPTIEYHPPPYPILKIAKEEQGERISRDARGKLFQSCAATRNGVMHTWCLPWRGISVRWGGDMMSRW